MYKVFVVEDEAVVREGLRDGIPWEQYGFTLAGTAADGEIALPMIRRERPDVLITDIRMPFMDGLRLSRVVRSEIPSIRIIILSGYSDFEYAQKAIEIGVDRFLTKPVTVRVLTKVLTDLAGKLDAEKQKEESAFRRHDEMAEYSQYLKRRFLEDVFTGSFRVDEIYQEAGRLRLNLEGPSYRVLLADIFCPETPMKDILVHCREDAVRFFLRHPQYLVTNWVNHTICAVVRGDKDTVEKYTLLACEKIREMTEKYGKTLDCMICVSGITERFSHLKECYEQVGLFFTCRYLPVSEKVITPENFELLMARYLREEKEDQGSHKEPESGDILQNALRYLEAHFADQDLSLNTVAAYVNVTPGYFSAMFSQRMNTTFIEYVTQKRIEKAKELLRDPDRSTSQIASLAGYRDSNYFRFVFKKAEHCTPREYRARLVQ